MMPGIKSKGNYKKMFLGLFGGHALSIIVALFASSLLGRFQNSIILAVMHIVCIGGALFFSYHEGWIAGSSDKNYISKEQLEYNPWKGVYAGAMASAINLIIAVLGFLSEVSCLGNWSVMDQGVFEIVYRIWFWAYSCIFPLIDSIAIFHFLPVLAMPIACGIGYVFGVKQFRLSEFLIYNKDND